MTGNKHGFEERLKRIQSKGAGAQLVHSGAAQMAPSMQPTLPKAEIPRSFMLLLLSLGLVISGALGVVLVV